MPRFASPPNADVERARAAVRIYLADKKLSQIALANEVGVSQYAVSRLLGGRTKGITPDIVKLKNFANYGNAKSAKMLLDDTRLRDALLGCWDGTTQGREALCVLLESLGPKLSELLSGLRATIKADGR